MARAVILEATPLTGDGSATVQVRLAGGGSRPYTGFRGFTDWRSGLDGPPRFTTAIGWGDTGWTGASLPQVAAISFHAADATLGTTLAGLMWRNARVVIRSGDDTIGEPAWAVELVGTIASAKSVGNVLELTIADLSGDLVKPLAPATFAGTGGIEGPEEATGRQKRRSWGRVFNVEGRILDKANSVYEFGDPAFPLAGMPLLKDKGQAASSTTAIAWQGSVAATFAALQAAAAPQGGGVVAPSIACAKWWTQPAGPLTCDLLGEAVAGAYQEDAGSIGQGILAARSTIVLADRPAVTALRSYAVGLHCGDPSESVAAALDRLFLAIGLVWVLSPAGTIRVSEIAWDNPVELLASQESGREATFLPLSSRKLGFQRNERIHTDGEISAALLNSSDLTYADGTPFEALKPAEAGATLGARAGTNLRDSGGVVLIDQAIKNSGVTIGANGALSGAGGGQVSISGLGYIGDLNATAGFNLVYNGDAERGDVDGWTFAQGNGPPINYFENVADASMGGARSFRLRKPTTDEVTASASRAFPVKPGERLVFAADAYGNTATGAGLYLRLHFAATKPGYAIVDSIGSVDLIGNAPFSTTPQHYEAAIVVPPGMYWASVGVYNWYTGPIDARFDNITVTRAYNWQTGIIGRPLNLASLAGTEAILNGLLSIAANGALSGGGGGQVTIVGLGYSGALNATYGAQLNVSLFDEGAAVLTSYGAGGVRNAGISIASNGALSGGGGGQVTLSGVGFSGDTDAQRNSRIYISAAALYGIGTGEGTAVANAGVSIGSNGVLSGGGGGQVLLGGLGFTGDTDAQRNTRITISASVILGIGEGAGVAVANVGVSIASNGALTGGGGGQVTLPGLGAGGLAVKDQADTPEIVPNAVTRPVFATNANVRSISWSTKMANPQIGLSATLSAPTGAPVRIDLDFSVLPITYIPPGQAAATSVMRVVRVQNGVKTDVLGWTGLPLTYFRRIYLDVPNAGGAATYQFEYATIDDTNRTNNWQVIDEILFVTEIKR